MNEHNCKMSAIFEPYDEVIALWEENPEQEISLSSHSYIAVVDTELVRDIDALRHELVMQMISIDAETGEISDIAFTEPMLAPSTEDMGSEDFLIRRWGYETPNIAIRKKEPYEPYVDEMMARESLIADVLEEHPEKLETVAYFSTERCSGVLDGYEPIRAAHEQWDLILRRYTREMVLDFLRSPIPRHRDMVIVSPFLALYDEIFAMWVSDDGKVRRMEDVVPRARTEVGTKESEGSSSATGSSNGLADVLASISTGRIPEHEPSGTDY